MSADAPLVLVSNRGPVTFGPNGDGVDSKFGSKTADAIKKFKVDFNLFGPTSSDVDKGVIAEIDNLNTVPF